MSIHLNSKEKRTHKRNIHLKQPALNVSTHLIINAKYRIKNKEQRTENIFIPIFLTQPNTSKQEGKRIKRLQNCSITYVYYTSATLFLLSLESV